jgi:hypothetical protein
MLTGTIDELAAETGSSGVGWVTLHHVRALEG